MQPTPIEPNRCPLCGQPNHCSLAAGLAPEQPCWCREFDFPPALLESVPAAARQRACICQCCVEQAQQPA